MGSRAAKADFLLCGLVAVLMLLYQTFNMRSGLSIFLVCQGFQGDGLATLSPGQVLVILTSFYVLARGSLEVARIARWSWRIGRANAWSTLTYTDRMSRIDHHNSAVGETISRTARARFNWLDAEILVCSLVGIVVWWSLRNCGNCNLDFQMLESCAPHVSGIFGGVLAMGFSRILGRRYQRELRELDGG